MESDSDQSHRERLTRLISDAADRVGNPIALIDTSYKLLAHSPNRVQDDPLWNELIEMGTFGEKTVNFFNQARFIQAVADSDDISLLRHDSNKYDRYCCKLFDDDGFQLGSVNIVACNRPFAAGDVECIRGISCELAAEIQRADGLALRESVSGISLIAPLLDGTHDLSRDEVQPLNALYERLRRYLYVVVIDILGYDPTLSHLAYMRDHIAEALNGCPCYIYMNNVVVIIDADLPTLNPRRDLGALSDFLSRYPMHAGISGVFQDLFSLRARYEQALTALNYGMNGIGGGGGRIHLYDSYRLLHAAGANKNIAGAEGLVHPIVVDIERTDRENGTALGASLRAYLACGRDEWAAGARLDIPPERLLSDLDMLSETYDIDMKDGLLLFSLYGSFMVMDAG